MRGVVFVVELEVDVGNIEFIAAAADFRTAIQRAVCAGSDGIFGKRCNFARRNADFMNGVAGEVREVNAAVRTVNANAVD